MEPDTDETVAQTADEIIEATRDFILKELSKNLKGYDLEPFVANLLQAMGYRTILSPHGGDRGIDITAYKDELPPPHCCSGQEPGWRCQRKHHPVPERRDARGRLWPVRHPV